MAHHHKIPPELLQVLACPLTKEPLKYDEVNNELISEKAGLAFPIVDGIPVMLVDRARKI
jgi:hypothetical protein